MKNISVLFVLIFIITYLIGCGTKEIQSQWTENEIIIDGDFSEWNDIPIKVLSDDPNIYMRVLNNNEYLYIMAGFSDQVLARMFQRNGVTLWLDNRAKKKKEFGIIYKSDIDIPNSIIRDNPFRRGDPSNSQSRFTRQPSRVPEGLSIIDEDGHIIQLGVMPKGPLGNIKVVREAYNVEFMIPLEVSDKTPYAVDASPGAKVSLGLEMDLLSKEEREMMEKRMSEMGGRGGMSGMGDRGSREGMGGKSGGGMGDRGGMQMPANKQLWINIFLAADE